MPDERKDAKYWDRRKKNNDAAKRSRDIRRKKIDGELKSAKDAIQENQKLKQEIDVSIGAVMGWCMHIKLYRHSFVYTQFYTLTNRFKFTCTLDSFLRLLA